MATPAINPTCSSGELRPEPEVESYISALSELISARQQFRPAFVWVDMPINRADGAHYLTPVRVDSTGRPFGHGSELAEPVTVSPVVIDASEAWWRMAARIREMIASAVRLAHHNLRYGISRDLGIYRHHWVDSQRCEAIIDEMTLVTTAAKIIERHTTDISLDVNHYTDALAIIRRDAADAISRAIGDPPRRGHQIRKLSKELGSTDPAEVHQQMTSQGITIRMDTIERALHPMPTTEAAAETIEDRYDL